MKGLQQFISNHLVIVISYLFLLSLITIKLPAQQRENAAFNYTEQLSKQFPDSAFIVLKQVYNHALDQKDKIATGICLQQMGQICFYLSNYAKSLDFHLQADKIFREAGMQEKMASNLNDMGMLYYYNKQMVSARKQYDEALSIYRRLGNSEGLAETYGQIGHWYEKQHRYDSAFFFQRLALEQYNVIAKKGGIAKIYENMGSIFEDLERYDSSTYYFKNALATFQQAGEEVASIEVLNNLGDIYRKTNRLDDALTQTRLALAMAKKTNDLYQEGSAYRDLGKTWQLLNRYDSAYHYLELSRKATIDIYSKENNRETAFLSVLFDMDKKTQEIVKLENDRRVTIIITTAVLIVIALLAILGWVIISRQRLKIKNERLLGEQNQRIYQTQKELMQKEITNKQLNEEKLVQELEVKKKGLATYTLHIIQKNQLLEDLGSRLEILIKDDKRDNKKQLQQLIQQIHLNFNHDQYWNEFRETFEQVHQQFFVSLKERCHDLTSNDLRLIALIKLNLPSKDIATLLAISLDSLRVSRYRLRKKLNLEPGEGLTHFVQSI